VSVLIRLIAKVEIRVRVGVKFRFALGWRRGVVVNDVGLINEVNRHWAR